MRERRGMNKGPSRRLLLRGGLLGGSALLGLRGASAAPSAMPPHAEVGREAVESALALPDTIVLGSADGDVTLIEFFDYNCPYCKVAARELPALMQQEPRLRVVLVNYAVLGLPSALAGKVAVAFSRQTDTKTYLAFHRQLFALRGTVDADRALEIAVKLGADRAKLIDAANDPSVARALSASASFGDKWKLEATPSYLIGDEAYSGYLSLPQKRAAIAAARKS